MKRFLLILMICLIPALSFAAAKDSEEPKDFRQATWGQSLRKVKWNEKAKLVAKADNALNYKGSLAGLEASIVYRFAAGELIEGKYIITENMWKRSDYIDSYNSLKDLLTQKYGEPVEDEADWKNPQHKDSPATHGLALGMGHVSYQVSWETERTKIIMDLWGEELDIMYELTYSSRMLENKDDSKEKILNDL